jgi:hypothetical protein
MSFLQSVRPRAGMGQESSERGDMVDSGDVR